MPVTDPIEFAARQFLRARDRFLHHSGLAGLDAYHEATDRLLAVFSLDWRGSHDTLVVAYQAFRHALIDQQPPTSDELHQFFRR